MTTTCLTGSLKPYPITSTKSMELYSIEISTGQKKNHYFKNLKLRKRSRNKKPSKSDSQVDQVKTL